MKAKTEMKKQHSDGLQAKEAQNSIKSAAPPQKEEEEEGTNKAWDLRQKLKARMDALHGRGKRQIVETRKRNLKKEMKLAESDETPDEFDPDDSDFDDSGSDDDSDDSD